MYTGVLEKEGKQRNKKKISTSKYVAQKMNYIYDMLV